MTTVSRPNEQISQKPEMEVAAVSGLQRGEEEGGWRREDFHEKNSAVEGGMPPPVGQRLGIKETGRKSSHFRGRKKTGKSRRKFRRFPYTGVRGERGRREKKKKLQSR